jgi:DNA-binding IclR family transcriptional regulator
MLELLPRSGPAAAMASSVLLCLLSRSDRGEEMSLDELAQLAAADTSSVTEALERLRDVGVLREVEDPGPGRCFKISPLFGHVGPALEDTPVPE